MKLAKIYTWSIALPDELLGRMQSVLVLIARVWIGWQFLKSGWLKLNSWETTLFLFEEEYRVPIISPEWAALAGTAGELLFPILLFLGLFGRLSALGLTAVNGMAVFAYAHVLYSDGFEAALAQHYLWGMILIMTAVYGPGKVSVDYLWGRGYMRPMNTGIAPVAGV